MAEFIGYPIPVAYASGLSVDDPRFTVSYDGATYAAVADAIPFTTGDAFDADQWKLVAGITADDLASGVGGSLVGVQSGPSGSVVVDAKSVLLGIGYTPEMFGAKGDGVSDDGPALKTMFANIPAGSRVYGRAGSVYLNKFASGYTSTPAVAVQCYVDFSMCELRGVPSVASHGQRALLRLEAGSEGSIINLGEVNGMENYGYMIDSTGGNISSDDVTYTVTAAITYGLHISGVGSLTDINRTKIYARSIRRNLFNVWCTSSYHVDLEAAVYSSGQLHPLTGTDLQTGDGVKVSQSYDCNFKVYGDNNTNSQFSFEPLCKYCVADVVGGRALTAQATIFNGAEHCKLRYRDGPNAATVESGKQSCLMLLGSSQYETTGVEIEGYITGDHPAGVLVRAKSGQTVSGFKIDLTTCNAPKQGVYFYCASDGVIDDYDVNYRRVGGFISGLSDMYLQGPVRRGRIRATFNSTTGLAIYGTGYVDDDNVIWCPVVDIDGVRCVNAVYRNTSSVGYIEGIVHTSRVVHKILPAGVALHEYAVNSASGITAFGTRANISEYRMQTSVHTINSSGGLTSTIGASGTLSYIVSGLPTTAPSTSDYVWSNGGTLTKVS